MSRKKGNLENLNLMNVSDSSDDEIPLRSMQLCNNGIPGSDDCIPYEALCKYSNETCDFCEKIFNNRFTAIKHHGKHIIIPLIRPTLLQCTVCLFCFTSQSQLKQHNETKHCQRMGKTKIQNRILFEDDDDLDFVYSNIYNKNNAEDCGNVTSDENSVGSNIVTEHNTVENNILSNVTNNCRVNLELFEDTIVLSSDGEEESVQMNNVESDENSIDSCHYDCLVRIDEFECRYCRENFNTRYSLLKHNLKHIHIRKPRPCLCAHCDRFFASKHSLKRHIFISHGTKTIPKSLHSKCEECNLPYFSRCRHLKLYHEHYVCRVCKQRRFTKEVDFMEHMKSHISMTECEACNMKMSVYDFERHVQHDHCSLKVCNICLLFLKDRNDIAYVNVGDFNVNGMRHPCERCGALFFELNRVIRIRKNVERLDYNKEKVQKRAGHKPLSNEARLKNIRGRIKKLK